MKPYDLIEALEQVDDACLKSAQIAPKRVPVWVKWASAAACVCLLIGAAIAFGLLKDASPAMWEGTPVFEPLVQMQAPSEAPLYSGVPSSERGTGGEFADRTIFGMTVTAKPLELLPDTYTLYDDWHQYEYRLLRLRMCELIVGDDMTEEFFFLIPAAYATDFTRYDALFLNHITQVGLEYTVLYNKTEGCAERLELVLFSSWSMTYLGGGRVIAYDRMGMLDERLWNSTDRWREDTEFIQKDSVLTFLTLPKAVKLALEYASRLGYAGGLRVYRLAELEGEQAQIVEHMASLENGIYAPSIATRWWNSHYSLTRYFNGFPTNEQVTLNSTKWGAWEDLLEITKAQFDAADTEQLPDLASAYEAVKAAYNAGTIKPPHIQHYDELTLSSYGIFGWYAKTERGVVGIVRVTWAIGLTGRLGELCDDAYFILEHGEDTCRPIARDDLLELFGDYETTYIFDGNYDEEGKILPAKIWY